MTDLTYRVGDDGIPDFSGDRVDALRFRIDDDVFELPPELPLLVLTEFVERTTAALENRVDGAPDELETMRDALDRGVQLYVELFDMVLTDKSAEVMRRRLSSKTDPIGLSHVRRVLPWILEQYGMRPTQPSSDSSPGPASPGDGTSSTASSYATVSTSTGYPFTGS